MSVGVGIFNEAYDGAYDFRVLAVVGPCYDAGEGIVKGGCVVGFAVGYLEEEGVYAAEGGEVGFGGDADGGGGRDG